MLHTRLNNVLRSNHKKKIMENERAKTNTTNERKMYINHKNNKWFYVPQTMAYVIHHPMNK